MKRKIERIVQDSINRKKVWISEQENMFLLPWKIYFEQFKDDIANWQKVDQTIVDTIKSASFIGAVKETSHVQDSRSRIARTINGDLQVQKRQQDSSERRQVQQGSSVEEQRKRVPQDSFERRQAEKGYGVEDQGRVFSKIQARFVGKETG
eukprot:TRINITY_DN2506_c0_g1_i2.p2 TRINITY_DN2506_c0_g1~~TRINITY_DN2506_c0_g1_i2.p2  ORF type:complete len:169 (+),score=16.81 TRINITY_DN2506_c0_g1_i2:56-508(+)